MSQQALILFLESRDFGLKRFNIYVHINQVVKHVSNGGLGGEALKLPHIAEGSQGDSLFYLGGIILVNLRFGRKT